MKKLLLFVATLLVLSGAAATENWEETCKAQGGCIEITRKALEHLLDEIDKLKRVIVAIRKEQCV